MADAMRGSSIPSMPRSGFTVDLAATKHTTLLARWFEDSLPQPWDGEVGWLNAPFTRGLLPQFVAEVCDGWRADRCRFAASGDERGVVP